MKNRLFVILFALFLAVPAVLTLALPKKEFSENENRMLAEAPKLSLSSLRDGAFMSGTADYITDHFVGRDLWVSVRSAISLLALRSEQNGVYRVRDGYIDGFSQKDTDFFEDNVSAVSAFGETVRDTFGIPVYTLVAPTATQIEKDRLPAFAAPLDAAPLFERLAALPGFIDVRDVFAENEGGPLYYRTDHHWTARGAYLAYAAFQSARGKAAESEASYGIEQVTDRFFGTLYSRFGLFDGRFPDAIFAPSAEALGRVTVTDGKGESRASVYDPSALAGKDRYRYFLGGNDPILQIDTEQSDGRLLLIKDSYANALLPYLLREYAHITAVDLRYYPGTVLSLLAEGAYDEVLILYNLKSFASDSYLRFLTLTDD